MQVMKVKLGCSWVFVVVLYCIVYIALYCNMYYIGIFHKSHIPVLNQILAIG